MPQWLRRLASASRCLIWLLALAACGLPSGVAPATAGPAMPTPPPAVTATLVVTGISPEAPPLHANASPTPILVTPPTAETTMTTPVIPTAAPTTLAATRARLATRPATGPAPRPSPTGVSGAHGQVQPAPEDIAPAGWQLYRGAAMPFSIAFPPG